MLNRSKMFSSDRKPHKDNPDSLDDSSAATPPWGSKSKPDDPEMTSKVLKFRFIVTATSNRQVVAPSVVHTHWMQAVQESMDTDIIIYNNRNKTIDKVDLIQWSNPLIHKRQFDMHQKTTGRDSHRKTTYYILHRVITNSSVHHIKSIPAVQRILRDHQCFVTEHQWTEEEWDTTQIGFVTGIDPSFYNASQAQVKFNTDLRKLAEITTANPKRITIPQFRMVFSSVRSDTQTGQKVTTKAYSLEVRTAQSLLMMQTLKSYLTDSALFVPYSMRRKYPAGFAKAIRFQTHQLTSNRTVILENISEDMMFYLKPHFQNISGVKDIIPAFDVATTGKQRLLVDKEGFTRIRAFIMKSLPTWCNNISNDAQPTQGHFPGPARVRPIHNDGMSSGDNSWLSASNASFMSMDFSTAQDDDYFTNSSKVNHTFSYAEILLTPNSTTYDYPFSVGKTTTHQPEEEGKEVISEITTGRSEIEAAQKAEIERLKEKHDEERAASRKIINEQTLEIQRLKDTQSKDAERNLKATEAQQKKNQHQDDATNKLRLDAEQTNLELQQMRLELQAMMNTLLQVIPTTAPPATTTTTASTKRNSKSTQETNVRQEKRINNQSTPAKKKLLFDDEVDPSDHNPHLSAMETEDANESF